LKTIGCNTALSRILWRMLGKFQWDTLAMLKESMQSSKILEELLVFGQKIYLVSRSRLTRSIV
jgi:hypothetical protein